MGAFIENSRPVKLSMVLEVRIGAKRGGCAGKEGAKEGLLGY